MINKKLFIVDIFIIFIVLFFVYMVYNVIKNIAECSDFKYDDVPIKCGDNLCSGGDENFITCYIDCKCDGWKWWDKNG